MPRFNPVHLRNAANATRYLPSPKSKQFGHANIKIYCDPTDGAVFAVDFTEPEDRWILTRTSNLVYICMLFSPINERELIDIIDSFFNEELATA